MQRIVVQLAQQRIDQEWCRDDKQCRAIRRRARDRLGAHRAAGSRPVFDDHRGAAGASGLLRHQTCDNIGGAAGRVRDDDPNGPCDLPARRIIRGKDHVSARSRCEHRESQ